jgi:hypothetical protein
MASKGTCKASGCEKAVEAKGYCPRHYSAWRKGKMPKPRYRSCNAEGCHKPRVRRGLCPDHFSKEYGKAKAQASEAAAPAPATS